jgi:hypothetical protein
VQPSDPNRPRFVAVTSLEDVQAVRCAEFHPNGTVYAVGSNSKTFRICEYPTLADIRYGLIFLLINTKYFIFANLAEMIIKRIRLQYYLSEQNTTKDQFTVWHGHRKATS